MNLLHNLKEEYKKKYFFLEKYESVISAEDKKELLNEMDNIESAVYDLLGFGGLHG